MAYPITYIKSITVYLSPKTFTSCSTLANINDLFTVLSKALNHHKPKVFIDFNSWCTQCFSSKLIKL